MTVALNDQLLKPKAFIDGTWIDADDGSTADVVNPATGGRRHRSHAGPSGDRAGDRVLPFGHMGDGNLHFNLLGPENLDRDEFLAHMGKVNRALHDLAVGMGGSFSAEHGIGLAKREDLIRYRSDVEIEMMTWIKSAFDPSNLMNPGKVIVSVPGP